LKQTGEELPFIVVSGTIGEERAVQMMKAGDDDYLLMGNLARLAPAVERTLREGLPADPATSPCGGPANQVHTPVRRGRLPAAPTPDALPHGS
jgi:hypothetical protein